MFSCAADAKLHSTTTSQAWEVGLLISDSQIFRTQNQILTVGMTMKKYVPEGSRDKEKAAACIYCKGTGRDLSRSLWGEFICPACGGTGKAVAKRVQATPC